MPCKGKKKLMAAVAHARSNLNFVFQNCRVKLDFSGIYALIQVICFSSTNFTWFNSIIKYKNLSTNKYVWFNKTFCLNLTKLFIIKKTTTFIQPFISPTQYILKLKYFKGESTYSSYKLFLVIAYLTWLEGWKARGLYAEELIYADK